MGRDENYPSQEAWHCAKKEHWALGAGYTAERKSTASQGSQPFYSEAGMVQLSRWSLALPTSSGVAATTSVFHWLCEKVSSGKGDGKPLTLSNWPTFGEGDTEVKGAGDRKSKVGQGRVLLQCVYTG